MSSSSISTLNPSLFIIFTLISTLTLTQSYSESNSDRVIELLHLQSQSKSGVIHLDDRSLNRFLTSAKSRSYSLLIFFDATQLHDKTELQLKTLRSEFDLVASAFINNNKDTPEASKVFFCDIEFKESQQSFAIFGVNALPHIRYVGPHMERMKESEAMDQSDFSRLAESMAEFVEAKTKLTVGPIERPPIVSKKQIAFMVVVFLASLPFIVKRILVGDTMIHDWKLWVSGSVFIYFFSVSGAMHNIIRKMPLFISDRNDPSKLVFFYQGSGMQLGAEGFAVGFLYSIVGLMLAFVTHALVHVRSKSAQRITMLFILLLSFWAVKKVVFLDNWKTGYSIHGYFPSGWN
ncbi:putative dolichyl-diphosphooligosaccharide--protein glycosyltransferase subunit 3B [Ranunculus cassubicifolius]